MIPSQDINDKHYKSRVGMDSSGRNLNFWPKAAAGEATEEEWKEFVKVKIFVKTCKDFCFKNIFQGGTIECWR